MNRKWLFVGAVLIAFITLVVSGVALAETLSYSLDWWTSAGGGGVSTSDNFNLSMTVGQPDANALSGSEYTLVGGIWPGGETVVDYRYTLLPLVVR